jgi:hypothetical protein
MDWEGVEKGRGLIFLVQKKRKKHLFEMEACGVRLTPLNSMPR